MEPKNAFPRVLPAEPCWIDQRLVTVRHNQFAWRAEPPDNLEEWEERKAFTQSQVALAAGLSPMPEMPPLKPELWGEIHHEGCIIQKVRFETMPGLEVTGNLFLPERLQGKAPAILCPHGHWPHGRVENIERGSIPMRCLMFARLGFIVLAYDMVGYNDNNQILHRWPNALLREAALSGAGMFGLQTWNSLRALDFLGEHPQVDQERIGCTGASGGASQTWTLAVLDERVKAIAPVCMLSSHYQGGCQCEEGPLLRLNGVTSFDILCACAPRPVLLPSVTQDWTNLNPRYEYEALRQVYALFDAEDAIGNFHADAPHNYNRATREHIYPWFTHWLLNQSMKPTIPEDNLAVPTPEQLLHAENPPPPTEATTRTALEKITAHLRAPALPRLQSKKDFKDFREERIPLLGEILNNDLELADIAVRVTCPNWEIPRATAAGRLLSRREIGDIIPGVFVKPNQADDNSTICLLLADGGKRDFFPGGPYADVLDLLVEKKCRALAIDLMGSGETADMPAKAPRFEDDPTFFAFNPTLFSMRVQDVLTALALLKEDGESRVVVVAAGEAARAALCALALAEPVRAIALDLDGVTDDVQGWLKPLAFQPMIFKNGGLKGALSILAPKQLGLFKGPSDLVRHAVDLYATARHPQNLVVTHDRFAQLVAQIIAL
ncbi:MAG: acetylxylan esterase [Lentisphaeria bacterium]|nr:acetylxylan esterase [Lentisphaeria bacterium]